jgi:ribosomal protein S18 acetylase RimI-like enzyme
MLELRNANREDIQEIAELIDASWKMAYQGIVLQEYLDTLCSIDRYSKYIDLFDAHELDFYVLLKKQTLIGAAAFGASRVTDFPNDGEITALYLSPDYFGNGYGKYLLDKVEQELIANGHHSFILDVLSKNYLAIRFYIKNGYAKVDTDEVKLGENVYAVDIMRKTI